MLLSAPTLSQQWHGRSMRTFSIHENNLCTQWPSLSAVFILTSVWHNAFSCLAVEVISFLSTDLSLFNSFGHWYFWAHLSLKAQKSCTLYSSVIGLNPVLLFDHFVPIVSLLSMMHCDISVKPWECEFRKTCSHNKTNAASSRAQNSSK